MTNLDVIKELYRAFRQKDYDAFIQICTPNIEWIQNEGFPRGGTYRGAGAVVEGVFKAFKNDWESWSFDIEQYLDAGETIIVIGSYTGCHQMSGKSFHSPAAHVYDIDHGKVCRFRQFTDTKIIWDAMN
ncbi:nuclear transport factor 2 family protein [Fortiea sp. LEGE XX443]|uniref:nuclear transport factor 2 family protein n=1 Tax=Fortiea sp. LEGE XX443 TaxID=1828611 RepID=UPI0018823DEF|nr:nuclear transport factor 2 family protein [Fortiea sp. LEGE XX443]MBE9004855.1 nuclear transport factor 2 family protein [Fortiea sp. LEGE XX443]